MRKSIRAGTDPYLAFLDYRNTPTQTMTTSPAQRLMGRRTKTLIPTTQNLLMPKTNPPEVDKSQLKEGQQIQAKYYNRSTKELPALSEGDVVRMKPFKLGAKSWPKAQVTARLDERSYTVEADNGAVYRRNRQHLKKTAEPPSLPSQPDAVSQPDTPNLPIPPAGQIDKSLESTPGVSGTPRQRPQRDRRPPAYLKDYVCS